MNGDEEMAKIKGHDEGWGWYWEGEMKLSKQRRKSHNGEEMKKKWRRISRWPNMRSEQRENKTMIQNWRRIKSDEEKQRRGTRDKNKHEEIETKKLRQNNIDEKSVKQEMTKKPRKGICKKDTSKKTFATRKQRQRSNVQAMVTNKRQGRKKWRWKFDDR